MTRPPATCGGPDRCLDDLCRYSDYGLCGIPSDRILGVEDDEDDDYLDDVAWEGSEYPEFDS